MDNSADIAIIGTGPAGISAALTAHARNKTIVIFGSRNVSRKVAKAHQINNYPGFPGKTGADIATAFIGHIDSLGIPITEQRITNVYAMGDHFSLLAGQTQYTAKAVIIATGTDFGKPFPGEEQFLGRGVSYCATCDGMLYKGKNVAVIADSREQEKEADFLASICGHVTYLPQYKDDVSVSPECEVIRDSPKEITGTLKAKQLVLAGGTVLDTDCIFILRESIAPSTLLSGLAMNGNFIAVDRAMKTSIPGCFAAGDITGTPYQIAKAVGEGNVAALSAVDFIN